MPVWFLSRQVESCEFLLRGRSSVGEHLLCKQGVVGSNPTVSMGGWLWFAGDELSRLPGKPI